MLRHKLYSYFFFITRRNLGLSSVEYGVTLTIRIHCFFSPCYRFTDIRHICTHTHKHTHKEGSFTSHIISGHALGSASPVIFSFLNIILITHSLVKAQRWKLYRHICSSKKWTTLIKEQVEKRQWIKWLVKRDSIVLFFPSQTQT